MIDFIEKFNQFEKQLARSVRDRVDYYFKHDCYKKLMERIDRLNSSWDMEIQGTRKNSRKNQSQGQFLAQLAWPLVKEQTLIRRSIFTSNYRQDPIFSFRAIGNTPMENAINMQDLVESNNEQTLFRANCLIPSIDMMVKWGATVVYSEFNEQAEEGWRTIPDELLGSRREYGIVKSRKNAMNSRIDIRNYFQNPQMVDNDESDYRGHIERRSLSWLYSRYKANPELYVKENIEKVFEQARKKHFEKNEHFHDPQSSDSKTLNELGRVMVNDVVRGQFKFEFEGNEDDNTYYYVEMIGDLIIRFQDNPYDMNLNQYTVLLCEPRYEYWWGNTPAEYSIQTENSMNLLMGLGLENAIESMQRFVFFNKNAIDPSLFKHAPSNGRIPVDVAKDVNLNNVLYSYQKQDTAGQPLEQAYRRLMENNQRVTTTPDLNRPASSGGPANKTAHAADIMASVGGTQDADLLEKFSTTLAKVGYKENVILAQFMGNLGPILIRPSQRESIREVRKANITGNYQVFLDTALQKTYQGEIMRYQNLVTWLLNLTNSGIPLKPNFQPLVKQVLKMGKMLNVDDILPESDQLPGMDPNAVQSQIQPGQELAGAAQELQQVGAQL